MANFLRNIHPLLRTKKRKDEYDDTNFSILNALNYELTQTEKDTIQSKIQSSLETSTGEYLDNWGDWFGVYREDGWKDDFYRKRIIREVLLKRSTIPAIIDALLDFLNNNDAHIEIYEPWRNIFYTNKSKLNGPDHLMGYYYRFAIIDIRIDVEFPPEIIDVINAFRPAGVLFFLRLNKSKHPSTKVIDGPWADVSVQDREKLHIWNGLDVDIRGIIELSDELEYTVEENIFRTNYSLLNGPDVLGGSFMHGRNYIHLASTLSGDEYTPDEEDALSDAKTVVGESGNDLYYQTKRNDDRSAIIQVPQGEKTGTYMVFDIYTYLEKHHAYDFRIMVNRLGVKEAVNQLFNEFTLSLSLGALVSPSNPLNTKVELFDFDSRSWHTTQQLSLTAKKQTVNTTGNQMFSYLNENGLLFVRLNYEPKEDQNVEVELDMFNILFTYEAGKGYSITSQMKVQDSTYTPAKDVKFYQDLIEIGIGETFNLEAKPVPESATPQDYTWHTNNSNVVSVNQEGMLRGQGKGQAKITVYYDKENFSAEIQVNVVQRPKEVNFEPEELTFDV